MIKLFLKTWLYLILIVLSLELLVRVFHLYPEDSPRFIDEMGVEKRIPNYNGFSVTGNRRQNFSEYHINNQGFNSYREFTPSYSKKELAIIGDSYIQGFHQNYYNSIGKKIENRTKDLEVYEYGYAGWDLADQLHLLQAYAEDFDKIDLIVIYMKYPMDLGRATYEPNTGRIKQLNSIPFKIRDNIKLLYYASQIGFLDPVKNLMTEKQDAKKASNTEQETVLDSLYIGNFDKLLKVYPINPTKTSILLDKRNTSPKFLEHCTEKGIDIIDFGSEFEQSKRPTTLIYDMHWNNNGRSLVAKSIIEHLGL
ncbi:MULTISPECIES: hypothetical protein [unclassified Flagellimonas]|uniref:SGNH/GDSL hydrolase family protein n=1 Tax=Flagellimonas sp. MMG031 TaxID=3158549 RepID=A0AAU7MWF8_9FLAO